jgi:hypothetical protein
MFRMLIGTHVPHLERYLIFLDDAQADVSQYLQNELLGTLMRYDEVLQKEVWDVIPEDMELEMVDEGFVIKNIPKWMLGHGAKKKYSPFFRSDLPGLRKEAVWEDVLNKLISDYQSRSNQALRKNHLLPESGPYTKLVIVLRSKLSSEVRDLDHYLPMLETIINQMCGVLITSDEPSRLSYAFEWAEDKEAVEGVFDVYGYLSTTPHTSWRASLAEMG